MDRRERYPNLYSYVQATITSALAETWVALPGILQSFNAADCTAAVQVAILMQSRDKNNEWTDITPSPTIPKAVVQFPGNKDYIFTFPLTKGDEGLLVFADRCIDAWWQNGGVRSQMDIRQHDLTDAIFIPGIRSLGNVPANINGSAAEFRTFSGNTKIAFSDAAGIVLTGNVSVTGALTATQNITAGQGGADQVTLQNHVHPSNGSPPTPGT
jgi:Phage protein Gp138 N-terminal domain